MKLSELRKLATFHAQQAAAFAQASAGMGPCPAAAEFLKVSKQHAEWAEQLQELAGAFEAFGHCLAE